ncbi:MAG: radical SAM family heme chaperone HemW [Firmicutes bacterium]|nr:radical SAM family heme chaperone HemW [Bacillota bacterium]
MKKNTVQKDLPLGLYIHIPFCRSKCAYCDFYSLAGAEERMDDYCRALERHLAEVAPQAECHKADTVYFGGGTPSYLGAERLCRLLGSIRKLYKVDKHAEITLEANPDSATDRKTLKRLRKAGFNRLSLGVQSMDDALLQTIGRIHTRQQVQEAVAAARKAGFKNLSLDLIYGLPGQTMEGWEKTLSDAVSLHPEHLSCYGLKLEEGTPLYRRQGELTFPDEDMQADMYLYTVEFLKQCGYEQYEISNFAKPGFASRHNLKYWLLQEYAGFGPGAHSDFGNVRYGYARDLERYLKGELVLQESETVDSDEREREYLMLRLRTVQGVDPREFEYRFRQRFAPLAALLQQCAREGLAEQGGNGWHLTAKGFLVSNRIIGLLQDELAREKNRRLEAAARGDYRVV